LGQSSLKGSWVSLRKPSFWREDDFALHQSIAQPKSGRPSCSKVRGDTKTIARPVSVGYPGSPLGGAAQALRGKCEALPPQLA